MNFGINLDYLYAKGEYADQAAKRTGVSLFSSYNGKHYTAYGVISTNDLSNYENGGITDASYITNPRLNSNPKNIPTNITGYANFKHTQLFYNHQYSIGFERPVKSGKDTIGTEYVPVTRFYHTLQLDDMRKRYYENSVEKTFYLNTYLPYTQTNDTAALQTMTNRFAISLAEEFNKWMKFGLTGFIENDIQRFTFTEDTTILHQLKSNTKVGGILAKELGQQFTYRILGEIDLLGYKAGDFVHTFGDTHIYTNHLEQVKLQLTRTPLTLPKMQINPDKKSIFDFNFNDFSLVGYEAHPHIKGDVSI